MVEFILVFFFLARDLTESWWGSNKPGRQWYERWLHMGRSARQPVRVQLNMNKLKQMEYSRRTTELPISDHGTSPQRVEGMTHTGKDSCTCVTSVEQ